MQLLAPVSASCFASRIDDWLSLCVLAQVAHLATQSVLHPCSMLGQDYWDESFLPSHAILLFWDSISFIFSEGFP